MIKLLFVISIAILILIVGIFIFFQLNNLIKKTNWYKNIFILTKDFDLIKYTKEHSIKIDIVNVGSNPARFSLFYSVSNGLNLSTGTQSLDTDLKILKHYSNSINEGAYIILPIVLFSSISTYLEKYKSSLFQNVKLLKVLPKDYFEDKRLVNQAERFIKYPLWVYPRSIRYIFRDASLDNRLYEHSQNHQHLDLMLDAQKWINIWKNEFHIKNLEAPLSGELLEARKKSIEQYRKLIDFVISRNWKPIILLPPISKELGILFTPKMKEIYVDSFLREFSNYNVRCLDYTYDCKFSDSSLFMNALFMNLEGRKLFTKEIIYKLK